MSKEEIYKDWAPEGGRWSPWVKPVLFACMDDLAGSSGVLEASYPACAWAQDISAETALVIDLPGAEAITLALSPSFCHFRPVPLYNAVPLEAEYSAAAMPAALDTQPIVNALKNGALQLHYQSLPPDAPPAFLLDANRRGQAEYGSLKFYDNRSISFTTDFPSANFLLSHGIKHALLIQRQGDQPQADLAHTLRRWQDGGVQLFLKTLEMPGERPVAPMLVKKPWFFSAFWYRAMMAFGLKHHTLGGFGGVLDETPSSS